MIDEKGRIQLYFGSLAIQELPLFFIGDLVFLMAEVSNEVVEVVGERKEQKDQDNKRAHLFEIR